MSPYLNPWVLDLGETHHITGNQDFFPLSLHLVTYRVFSHQMVPKHSAQALALSECSTLCQLHLYFMFLDDNLI